jgi:hypothetical protein
MRPFMTTDDPLATVQRMLEAFGNGELDGPLQTVHPDSRWTYVLAPTRARRKASTSAGTV